MIISELLTVFRLIVKSKTIFIAVGMLVFTIAVMVLASYFSGRQPATVALDVGLSVLRLLLPLYVVFLVQELFFKEFERRYCFNTFSYPRARVAFLLSRVIGVVLSVLFFFSLVAISQIFLVDYVGAGYEQSSPVFMGKHFLLVMMFLFLDIFVVISLSVLLSVSVSTSNFIFLGVFGCIAAARSYGSVIQLLHSDSALVSVDGYASSLGLLRYFLPDLGRLDVREISLYGQMGFLPVDWPWVVAACLSYSIAMLGLAAWVLNRKQLA